MFKKILVPVDGSFATGKAIDKALALAVAFQSAVTVMYVIDPYAFTGLGSEPSCGQAQYLAAATREASEAIGNARQAFESCGIAVKSLVVEGSSVYQAILDTAETLEADLVVMGSHGRRGFDKLVLGSVTAQVLSHARLSVLVVRD